MSAFFVFFANSANFCHFWASQCEQSSKMYLILLRKANCFNNEKIQFPRIFGQKRFSIKTSESCFLIICHLIFNVIISFQDAIKCTRVTMQGGSVSSSVGRAVASYTRGPWFESSHRRFIMYIYHHLYWKDKNKEKHAVVSTTLKLSGHSLPRYFGYREDPETQLRKRTTVNAT